VYAKCFENRCHEGYSLLTAVFFLGVSTTNLGSRPNVSSIVLSNSYMSGLFEKSVEEFFRG